MRKVIFAINNTIDGFTDRQNLNLINVKKFNSGVLALHYQKKKRES